MKKFAISIAALLVIISATLTTAQIVPNPPPQNNAAATASGPAGVITNTSGLNFSVSPGPMFCNGGTAYVAATLFTGAANQTYQVIYDCTKDAVVAQQTAAAGQFQIQLGQVVCGATTCATITDQRAAGQFPNSSDNTYIVPLGDCQITVGASGTLAAAVLTGAGNGGTNPGPFRTAAGSTVLQAITTAAANVLNLDCDITPPSKLTAVKGVTVNNVQLFYGVQTTALTSITAPTIQSLTYPATGVAAGLTNATAGGALTVLPASLQLTTTTTGQCFSENIALGTPINVVTDLQRITLDQVFNQTGAAATTLQVCGLIVHYTYIPL